MNKGELISTIADDAGLTKAQATEAYESVVGSITKTLKKGDRVSLIGFGSFSVNKRPERQGVNPATGDKITIKAKTVVKFKAGKALDEEMNPSR